MRVGISVREKQGELVKWTLFHFLSNQTPDNALLRSRTPETKWESKITRSA